MALPNPSTSSIGSGQTYSTVASWEADLDDAQLGEDYTGEITGLTGDNTAIYFSGVDTTASYWITLKAATGQEADGTDAKGAQVDNLISFENLKTQ